MSLALRGRQRQGESERERERERETERDIEPPLFAPAPRHNQIELTPVSRFLPLTDPLYFRDRQTTRRDERKPGRSHARAHTGSGA